VVEETDNIDIAQLVDIACMSDLSAAVRAGYDAPFPNEASKAGAYAWLPMVLQNPTMPGADRHAQLREDLANCEAVFRVVLRFRSHY
jgi:haloalkane dehalogenase